MRKEVLENLKTLFKGEEQVLVAYLFGSQVRNIQTLQSDIDIAVLLSETPQKLLGYYLYLVNRLSKLLGNNVDLIILNTSPPLLKFQVIKYGKVIYSQNEEVRIKFETKAQSEFLDFSIALARYDECLMKILS